MEQSLFSLVLQSVIGLAAVLGLFAFMVWGMRRFQDRSMHSGRDFRLLQKIYIDNRSSIVEVRHQGRHYLLALSANGICQLSPDQALPADRPAANGASEISAKGEA
ncbi:MAG: flagellar biosynthetic protein FliO [Mariprofundaceae bacterium]